MQRDELIVSLAAKHEPVYGLGEALEFKNVARLKKLAGSHGVKGYSGMTKPELIRALTVALPDEKRMADDLTIVDDYEWEFLQQAASCRELAENDAPDYAPIFLMGIGYIEAFHHNDKLVFVVPDEIKATLHKLMQSGYGDERDYITLLNKYAKAATSTKSRLSPQPETNRIANATSDCIKLTMMTFHSRTWS